MQLLIKRIIYLGLEKILKWVTKKKRENCFLPRAIMTKISATQEQNFRDFDAKFKEIV